MGILTGPVIRAQVRNNGTDTVGAFLLGAGNDTQKVNRLNSLSEKFLLADSIPKSEKYAAEALILANKIDFKEGAAEALCILGDVDRKRSNYEKATAHYLTALKIYDTLNLKNESTVKVWVGIGAIYFSQKNYGTALKDYKQALTIAQTMKAQDYIQTVLNHIGASYYYLHDLDSAMTYYLRSLKIREQLGDKMLVANSNTNIGLVYLKTKEYEKALTYHQNSLKLFEEAQNPSGIANSLNNMGDVYHALKQYGEAEKYYLQSLEIAGKTNEKERQLDNFGDLAENYASQKKFEKAYQYARLEKQLSTRLFIAENTRRIAELQAQYEAEKKENDNKLLTQQNEFMEAEIEQEKEKRRMQLFTLLGSLCFLALTFWLLYSRYKLKQQSMTKEETSNEQDSL